MRKEGYGIYIPNYVRQDESVSPGAKLLFGDLRGLGDKHGFCFANNSYLAGICGVTERQVRTYLSELEAAGHIRIDREDGRKIYTAFRQETSGDEEESCREDTEVNCHHTNTYNTLTYTKAVAGYFEERGLTPIDADLQANAFIAYWDERGGGPTPDKFKRHAATWLTNAAKYGTVDMPRTRMTKDEFGEAQRQAHLAGKKFDTTGWKLEGDMWVKKS